MHCHHSMTNYRISTKLPNLVPHKDSRINPQTTGHLWFTFANYDIQHYRNIHFGPAPSTHTCIPGNYCVIDTAQIQRQHAVSGIPSGTLITDGFHKTNASDIHEIN